MVHSRGSSACPTGPQRTMIERSSRSSLTVEARGSRKARPWPRTQLLLVAALCCCSLVVCGLPTASASPGDRSKWFKRCVDTHTARACKGYKRGNVLPKDRQLWEGRKQLSFAEELLGWTCEENVRYHCMHDHTQRRLDKGANVLQYGGKWPFVRVFGIQEIVSTLASIGNAVPHALYFFFRRHEYATTGMPWSGINKAYSCVAMNTWFWSTVFHARDSWWTERLDYHCASALVLFAFYIAVVRYFDMKRSRPRAVLATVFFLLLLLHIGYLNLVKFDYGYNMAASVVVGLLNMATWCAFVRREKHPARHKIYTVYALMWLLALMEVFDFPPFWGIFDAHSLWHTGTIPLGFLNYSFLVDDCRHEMTKRGVKLV